MPTSARPKKQRLNVALTERGLAPSREKARAYILAGDVSVDGRTEARAGALVSPCPLCHLNLDAQQPAAKAVTKHDIDLPILHLPQLIGLALGVEPKDMRLDHHVVSTKKLLDKMTAPTTA